MRVERDSSLCIRLNLRLNSASKYRFEHSILRFSVLELAIFIIFLNIEDNSRPTYIDAGRVHSAPSGRQAGQDGFLTHAPHFFIGNESNHAETKSKF
jgi:hypothetical protein